MKACLLFILLLATAPAIAREALPLSELESSAWWLQRAVKHADGIADEGPRSYAHHQLTYVLAREGDLLEAARSAAKVTSPQHRLYGYSFVAKRASEVGDEARCQAALAEARRIALAGKIFMNSHLARLYCQLGRSAEAESFAAAISDQRQRQFTFSTIANELAGQGDLAAAERIADAHLSSSSIDYTRSRLASACAGALHVDDAEAILKKVRDPKYRDTPLQTLVTELTQVGRVEEARLFADRISDARKQAESRAVIAQHTAQAETTAAIEQRFAVAKTREMKLALGNQLFDKLVAADEVERAEAVLENMVQFIRESPREAVRSKFGTFGDAGVIAGIKTKYLQTARLVEQAGDRDGARQRLVMASESVEGLPFEAGLGKIMHVKLLIRTQLLLGEFAAAQRTIDRLEGEFSRSNAAADLAVALIQSGDIARGLKTANLITAKEGRGAAKGQVAAALVRAGESDRAQQYLSNVGESNHEVRAFRKYGAEMIQLDRAADLSAGLVKLPSNAARSHACLGAAEQLAKLNQP